MSRLPPTVPSSRTAIGDIPCNEEASRHCGRDQAILDVGMGDPAADTDFITRMVDVRNWLIAPMSMKQFRYHGRRFIIGMSDCPPARIRPPVASARWRLRPDVRTHVLR